MTNLKDQAMTFARDGFEERVGALAEAAKGDPGALMSAASALTAEQSSAGTAEHIAFTYLVAASKRLTQV